MIITKESVLTFSLKVFFFFFTEKRLDHVTILDSNILPLIRNLNPNKATGSDGISGHMLLLCDESVVLPLK